MRLWDWVVQAHGAPGADEALVELQDEHGQCVSFLLWGAWSASEARLPGPAVFDRGARLARRWEAEVTGPIRTARRALKPAWPDVDDGARQALRSQVKADELGAERLLLDALEALTPPSPAQRADLTAGLEAAAAAWGPPPPQGLLDRLARMFDSLDF